MAKELQVIGVYKIEENADVHLIELIMPAIPSEVQVDEITQEISDEPRENWQVAYDERYLNSTGDKIIGDYFDLPKENVWPTRIAFFLYCIDFSKPILTQFGPVSLSQPIKVPDRLRSIISFKDID
jgi:hypothetical protein